MVKNTSKNSKDEARLPIVLSHRFEHQAFVPLGVESQRESNEVVSTSHPCETGLSFTKPIWFMNRRDLILMIPYEKPPSLFSHHKASIAAPTFHSEVFLQVSRAIISNLGAWDKQDKMRAIHSLPHFLNLGALGWSPGHPILVTALQMSVKKMPVLLSMDRNC